MKGVILAGGNGTRLLPLTKNTNKHLLPIFDRLMIEYPIRTLVRAGIKDILIISGPEHMGDIMAYLGSGNNYKVKFSYKIQKEAGGTAQALALSEDFARGGPVMVIMGDQILEGDFSKVAQSFQRGAQIFIKSVKNPQRYSVAILDKKKVVKIIEKPTEPLSRYALAGVFLFDTEVFNILKQVKLSSRGELELPDVFATYINNKSLRAGHIKGFWIDAGTFESLVVASRWAMKKTQPKTINLTF
ncbi:MAG: sugar phosphate nucleotidyltransferase [bacterium]|nr:sugar phosphate nucleotidyltransferase [bacterium]